MPLDSASSKKRTADTTEPTTATYAVCTSCSRISQNLQNCDNCGSVLSPENSVGCYGAEPKRSRIGSESPAGSNPQSPNTFPSSNGPPVPQGLFVNKNTSGGVVTSSASAVHPQSLYMNIGNSHSGSNSSGSGTPPANGQVASPAVVSREQSPMLIDSFSNLPPGTQVIGGSLNFNSQTPGPPATTMNPVAGDTPQSNDRGAAGDHVDHLDTIIIEGQYLSLPAAQVLIGLKRYYPMTLIRFKDDGILFTLKDGGRVTGSNDVCNEKHSSNTDYTFAPVLLNARALTKVQMNTNLLSYPLLMLYLENSCMRQIRNIFGLKDDEFCETSPCEFLRCITICPLVTKNTIRTVLELNISDRLRNVFLSYEQQFGRFNKYVTELTNNEAIDMLMSLWNTPLPEPPPLSHQLSLPVVQPPVNSVASYRASAANLGALTGAGQVYQNNVPQSGVRLELTNHSLLNNRPVNMLNIPSVAPHNIYSMTMRQPQLQHSIQSQPNYHQQTPTPPVPAIVGMQRPNPNVHPRSTISSIPSLQTVRNPVANNQPMVYRPTGVLGPTTRPTLVIPQDPLRWAEMQKNLVMGGVYHVQHGQGAGKSTMYCLWNGTQLVPCVVQNTEVQLEVSYAWVGSLKCNALGFLRIKADNPQGLFVELAPAAPGRGLRQTAKELHIPQQDIKHCYIVQDPALYAMFICPTTVGANRMRATFNLSGNTDPTLIASDPDKRRQRVVVVFNNINKEQWDAMQSMKFSGRNGTLFTEVDAPHGLKLLAESLGNHKVVQKLSDVLNRKEKRPNLVTMQNMVRALCVADGKVVHEEDDDDDDVIMTQEEVGIKCPYTQKVMENPIRNKICGHNYEKAAIQEFILRKKGSAKCPYAGCGNTVPLAMGDLEDNYELKEHIKRTVQK